MPAPPSPPVKRRAFLGLAAAAVPALAGCTASALPRPDLVDEPTPTDDDWPEEACPDLIEAARSVCPAEDDGPLAVERAVGPMAGDGWTLRVTATNRAGEPYGCNPHAWSVFRREGEAWVHVAPDAHVEPWVELGPGETYSWLLSATDSAAADGQKLRGDLRGQASPRDSEGADQRIFLALEPGQHAFVVAFEGPERLAAVVPFVVAD